MLSVALFIFVIAQGRHHGNRPGHGFQLFEPGLPYFLFSLGVRQVTENQMERGLFRQRQLHVGLADFPDTVIAEDGKDKLLRCGRRRRER